MLVTKINVWLHKPLTCLSTTYSRTISLDWGIPSWPACRRNERKVMGPLCVTLEGFGCKCEDDIWITWKWYLPWNYFGVTCKNIRTTIPHTNYWHRCMLRRLSVLFTNSTHSLTGFHTEQLVAIRDCPSWDPLKVDYRAVLVYSYRWISWHFYHGNWRALHHHAVCWLVNIYITWPSVLQLP